MPYPATTVYPSEETYPGIDVEAVTGQSIRAPGPGLRVATETPAGRGYDLTEEIEGLRFSNVNPGGDETANFTYRRPWSLTLPEIAKGNVVRITSGLDVIWQGRIDEVDRGGDASQAIDIGAVGAGARLKDATMVKTFVDAALENWQEPPRGRQADELGGGTFIKFTGPELAGDDVGGNPALVLHLEGPATGGNRILSEAWYDAGRDEVISDVYFDWDIHNAGGAIADFFLSVNVADDDEATNNEGTGDLFGTATGAKYLSDEDLPTTRRRWAFLRWRTMSDLTGESDRAAHFRQVRVYGDHSLLRQGPDPGGFTADQIAGYAVGMLPSGGSLVLVRRLDAANFVISHFVVDEPSTHEDVVSRLDELDPADWGTWGPDSVLERSRNGYFDRTVPDLRTQHWIARRSQLDDIDLHTELGSLFDTAEVSYEDASGATQLVTRSIIVPELDETGLSPRVMQISAGTMPKARAEELGDAALALQGGVAPARGRVTVSRPIRHHQRGPLPPYYMRADGANFRLPDILPTQTLFALDSSPDRRTTFPIKRVDVDASGEVPSVSVELDQTNSLLSVLQARLALAAETIPGRRHRRRRRRGRGRAGGRT